MQLEVRRLVAAPIMTPAFVRKLLVAVEREVKLPAKWTTLSVVVVGDRVMRRLNRQYRQQDYIPDVLSFPYGQDGGEVVICYPQAKRQAGSKQVSFRRELAWLAIHGILHIMGYDHETAADAKIMRPLEQTILKHV